MSFMKGKIAHKTLHRQAFTKVVLRIPDTVDSTELLPLRDDIHSLDGRMTKTGDRVEKECWLQVHWREAPKFHLACGVPCVCKTGLASNSASPVVSVGLSLRVLIHLLLEEPRRDELDWPARR